MTVPAPPRLYTADEVEAMENAIDYELDHGHLVERNMGFRSEVVGNLVAYCLTGFVKAQGIGYVSASGLALHIYPEEPNHFRKADVSFVRKDRVPAGALLMGSLYMAPDLVVEVLSPNDKAVEVEEKVAEYLDAGVELVWIVYPETRSVTVRRQDGSSAVFAGDAVITGDHVLPGFECPVREFFPE